ncbi:hypothetical protein [Rhizobium sp. 18055]|jgi:hypothetical protein|uniref:hypothetical protein n=1 Tax=Rhizobium sp. 18055 TaxID=2681403 RepID=UPI001FCE7F35|nr:hypothetical protein [Rhizobium sp. 18055]
MVTKTDWPKEALTSEAMEALDRVLRAWCLERAVAVDSEQGQATAKALIDWFEFGVHDEQELARLARDELQMKP